MSEIQFETPDSTNPALQSWSARLGQLVSLIGRPDFNETVANILHDVVPFDHFTAYHYGRGHNPLTLYHNVVPERADHLVHFYASDPFRLDPFYKAAWDAREGGVVALRTLSPEFERTDYYRIFYRDAGIEDEVGFIVRLDEQQSVVVSLLRDLGSPRFSREERDRLCWREPLMRELFRQQWGAARGAASVATPVVQAAHSGVAHLLSRREFEIVSLIITGHSSEAISSILEISLGTVKVHRKNIYRKLSISSQAELFHLCLTAKAGPSH